MIDIPIEQALQAINTVTAAEFIMQVQRMAFKVSLESNSYDSIACRLLEASDSHLRSE